jgi:hypothetical protein
MERVALCLSPSVPNRNISDKFFVRDKRRQTLATSLDTDQANALVLNEVVESADGIATTANTGNDSIGKLATKLLHLLLDLRTDDFLEVSDDGGERMRPNRRTDQVVCRG